MSSIKCQPCLVEPYSLNLKLTPPKSNLSQSSEWSDPGEESQIQENKFNSFSKSKNNQDIEKDSWSFLQALNKKSERSQKTETEKVYVHPLAKRSSSMLSQKSLEMCTENLGSETGSEMSLTESYNNDIALFFAETEKLPTKLKSNENWVSKRQKRSVSNFPPPLSSISSSNSLQMRSYREDGRLVLTATSGCYSYFEAERSNGRLKLTMFDSVSSKYDNGSDTENKHEEEEVEEENEENPEEIKEEKWLSEEEEKENRDEDKKVNSENGEVEMGIEKLKKLIFRCKEGGHGNKQLMINWEQVCVAT